MYTNKKFDGTSRPYELSLENFRFKNIKKNNEKKNTKIDFFL